MIEVPKTCASCNQNTRTGENLFSHHSRQSDQAGTALNSPLDEHTIHKFCAQKILQKKGHVECPKGCGQTPINKGDLLSWPDRTLEVITLASEKTGRAVPVVCTLVATLITTETLSIAAQFFAKRAGGTFAYNAYGNAKITNTNVPIKSIVLVASTAATNVIKEIGKGIFLGSLGGATAALGAGVILIGYQAWQDRTNKEEPLRQFMLPNTLPTLGKAALLAAKAGAIVGLVLGVLWFGTKASFSTSSWLKNVIPLGGRLHMTPIGPGPIGISSNSRRSFN